MSMAAALIGGLAVIDDDISSAWDVGARHGRSDGAGVSSGQISGVTLIVIDPEAFGGGERYGTMVGNTLAAARRVKPADGVERVLTPGEPEVISRERRGNEGIPLPDAIWQDLTALSERFGVPLPTPN
jgi:LDH2 family malate/lactate/ureidoglycolate dehydrogenase